MPHNDGSRLRGFLDFAAPHVPAHAKPGIRIPCFERNPYRCYSSLEASTRLLEEADVVRHPRLLCNNPAILPNANQGAVHLRDFSRAAGSRWHGRSTALFDHIAILTQVQFADSGKDLCGIHEGEV